MKNPILNINQNEKKHFLNFEPSDDELKKIEEEIENLINEEN